MLVDSERLVCRIEADLLLSAQLPVDWMYQRAMAQANGFRAELREQPR